MAVVKSYCRLCAGTCGTLVETDTEGRLVSVRGDHDNPVTLGYACQTGLQAPDIHNAPGRLLRPLKRLPDGALVEVGLEEALDEIAERLQAIIASDGADAVAAFKGTAGYSITLGTPMFHAWLQAIGSTSLYTTMTVDQSAKYVAMERLGTWGAGPDLVDDSDVLLVLGGNPMVSATLLGYNNLNPVKRMKEARERGMRLLVVDPRRTETAAYADLFVQPLPGEDAAILAGMIRIILEQGWHDEAFCAANAAGLDQLAESVAPFTPDVVARRAGITCAELLRLAELFARDGRRGAAMTGCGPNMGPHSNLVEHLVGVLNVICGRFRREGEVVRNNCPMVPRRERRAEVSPPTRSWEHQPFSRIRGLGRVFGERPACELVDEIETSGPGQIKALFAFGANPVGALPDSDRVARVFGGMDLLVTLEPFMNHTAKLADYIIPPPLMYERQDAGPMAEFYPLAHAQYTPAVAAPPPGAELASEWYVFWGLARRMGLALSLSGQPVPMDRVPEEEELLAAIFSGAQLSLDEIRATRGGVLFPHDQTVQPPQPHAAARFDLVPDDVQAELRAAGLELGQAADDDVEDGERFAFRLSVRRLRGVINTAYHDLPANRKRMPRNLAYLNPADLAQLGLSEGDAVDIVSRHGRIPAMVAAEPAVRRRVVSMSHGWGSLPGESSDYLAVGSSTSLLIDSRRDLQAINGMARLTAVPVNVERRSE